MLSIHIYQVQKTKDADLQRMVSDFYKRIGSAKVEEVTFKSEEDMVKSLPQRGFFIALEANGKMLDSEKLAKLIEEKKNQGISSLFFLIGPPDGFTQKPESIDMELSLSAMTFSHQTIRLLLAEQLYRATAILEGKPFAKH